MTRALATMENAHQVINHERTRAALVEVVSSHGHNIDAFLSMAMQTVSSNPELLKCSAESVMGALKKCAAFGLMPNGAMGHAYIIPFQVKSQKTAQFIPGYRGLIKLALDSGRVKKIVARTVKEGDAFEVRLAPEDEIYHRPAPDCERGRSTHYYAIATLADGTTQFDYMTRDEVEKVRQGSRGKDSLMWTKWFDEGGKKTVVRRLCKYLPMKSEFQEALDEDDQQYLQPVATVRDLNTDALSVSGPEQNPRDPNSKRDNANNDAPLEIDMEAPE